MIAYYNYPKNQNLNKAFGITELQYSHLLISYWSFEFFFCQSIPDFNGDEVKFKFMVYHHKFVTFLPIIGFANCSFKKFVFRGITNLNNKKKKKKKIFRFNILTLLRKLKTCFVV